MAMFLVRLRRIGPGYRLDLPLEQQSGWHEHAAFMDALVDAGFIVLGGPLGDEVHVVHVVLAVDAETEEGIRATLARDPWSGSHLVVEAIDPWTIRLGSPRSPPER